MAGIDLANYETVKQRKKRFYADYPDGRIIVEIQNEDVLDHALFMAEIYKNGQEQLNCVPFATGYAHEIRDKELKVSQYGKQYESVNFTSWVENCEESAIGRALDNAGYSGNNKCSKEEMQKVVKLTEKPKGDFLKFETALVSALSIKAVQELAKLTLQRTWSEEEEAKIEILVREAYERFQEATA